MQDVTDLAFMRVIAHYGAPDLFFTEFFRVHSQSRPEKHILRSIDENDTGRPVFAQLIGEDLHHLSRTVDELLRHPVAGIDLNLGCPAPKVYRKNVGGGLLREPERVGEILACLRARVPGLLSVKMRIGFEDARHFDRLLELVATHRVDLLSVHGRTVRQMYRGDVDYELIARAVGRAPCPVLANGNLFSAERAARILSETRAAGVMIGRHAIRNPWIFRQCRERFAGTPVFSPSLTDVREYIDRLYRATAPGFQDEAREPEDGGAEGLVPQGCPRREPSGQPRAQRAHVARMKKYLNFVGQSVDPQGAFLREVRRAETEAELFSVCDRHLLAGGPFALEPYPGVIARPNCETPVSGGCSLDTMAG